MVRNFRNSNTSINGIICINKPTNLSIVISALEIVHSNLFVVVITTISEGVNGCNIYTIGKLGVGNCTCDNTPRIVRVFGNSFCVLVNDSDNITLKVLDEVVGNVVIKNTAYSILVIIERNERVVTPSFTENLGSVKNIFVLYSVDSLARSDAICIVGILNVIKLFELSSLFPSQRVTEA